MINSGDAIGNRTRDLPACSAVPQSSVPSRAPLLLLLLVVVVVVMCCFILSIDKHQYHSTCNRYGSSLTHKPPKIEEEKFTKYEHFTPEIKNIWKLNNVTVYLLVISADGVVTRNFPKV
jgi:hypothetical protein